jgi:hypothetical protein
MVTSWNTSIQRRAWLNVHRDPPLSGQPDDIAKLAIGSHDEQTLEWANTGAKRLAHGMEAVDHLRSVIVSIDWCHLAGPRS